MSGPSPDHGAAAPSTEPGGSAWPGRLFRLPAESGLTWARGGLIAVLVAAAVGVRWILLPVLDAHAIYLTVYPVIAVSAVLWGKGPGVLAAVLGQLATDILFVAPDMRLQLTSMLSSFIMIAGSTLFLGHVGDRWRASKAALKASVAAARAAEEALRESESRYRSLFTSMDEGFQLCEPLYDEQGKACDFRFIDVNPAFERHTGLTRDQVLGRTVREVLPEIEPYWIDLYGRVAKTGEPRRYENYARALERWYAVYAFSPSPGRFAAVSVDITERRRTEDALRAREAKLREVATSLQRTNERLSASEERYRLLNQATHDVIWDWDLTTGALLWNEAVESTFGYRVAEVPNQVSWWFDHIHPDDRERAATGVHAVIADPAQSAWTAEYRFRHRDGRWLEVLDRGLVARDERGRGVRMIGSMLDLTERRSMDRRLRRLLEASPIGAVLGDASGRFLYANDAYLGMIGTSREQFDRGEVTWERITPPEHRERDRLAIERALTHGASEVYEKEYVRPDGSRFPVLLARASLGGGELATFTLDISERKRAEEALRRSEATLSTVLETLPIGVVVADAQGRIIRDNAATRELWGVPPETASWEEYGDWVGWWPETGERIKAEDWAMTRALRFGEVTRNQLIEIQPFDRQEHRHYLHNVVPLRDAEGRIVGGVAAMLDVTDRLAAEENLKASERKFRSVFEQAALGMGRVNLADGRWIDVNDAFCRMLGYTPQEMLATPWPAMTHPEDVDLDLVPFRRMGAGELDGYTVEKRFIHRFGRQVWARLTLSLVRDAQGRPDYEIAIVEDITQRKEIEQALRDANARLLEADRRKNEFLAILSHELRNPLAPIKNSVYILEHAAPGAPQAQRAHQVIERQVDHMTRLVEDLLDVTRISRGKVRLHREPVELCGLVHRTAEDHRSTFHAAGVQLELMTCEGPLHTSGDPTRISQIIGNLLTNAAKFTQRGGRVTLSLGSEQGAATIRVRDNGAGIAPALLKDLFTPFVQADATLDRSKGGLGLGLALVKGLVELHGGTVTAESEGPGAGALFTVRLPLERPEASAERRAQVRPRQAGDGARRVLVIEDNMDAAESLKEALELNGHEVEIAASGPEGIEKARAFHPDIVLCDIGLPGIDGFEVARRMRADPDLREAPLVALSGYAAPEDLERSRAAGFVRHLVKPPDLHVLESTLSSVWPRQDEAAAESSPTP